MDNKGNNVRAEKTKEAFSNLWQKTSDMGKKAAEGAKAFADQTKKNIYDAQAKKYTTVTLKELKSKSFMIPNIIEIVDDSSNRKFITDENAIGWIEQHEGIDVLHLYSAFVKKCNVTFIPLAQRDSVYCKDNFDPEKFIDANQVFGKATEEKLAELEHIAYALGAKCCSVEIIETDSNVETSSKSAKINIAKVEANSMSKNSKKQSGKTMSYFEGNATPKEPQLKWFAPDENIKRLIEMRCADCNSIKSKSLELKGSSSATMSKKTACAIDNVLKIKGGFSMENQAIKEHSNILVYEIEF